MTETDEPHVRRGFARAYADFVFEARSRHHTDRALAASVKRHELARGSAPARGKLEPAGDVVVRTLPAGDGGTSNPGAHGAPDHA